MSAIRERADELSRASRNRFICLEECIEKIAVAYACAIGEAAGYLLENFNKLKDSGVRCILNPAAHGGEIVIASEEHAREVLRMVEVMNTLHLTAYALDFVEYGFNRANLAVFLQRDKVIQATGALGVEPTVSCGEPPGTIKAPSSALPPTRWPWGSHQTAMLGHLEAAAQKFWVNYDPGDNTTAPTNEDVSDWLETERKISNAKAKAIASILRPEDLPTGPRK